MNKLNTRTQYYQVHATLIQHEFSSNIVVLCHAYGIMLLYLCLQLSVCVLVLLCVLLLNLNKTHMLMIIKKEKNCASLLDILYYSIKAFTINHLFKDYRINKLCMFGCPHVIFSFSSTHVMFTHIFLQLVNNILRTRVIQATFLYKPVHSVARDSYIVPSFFSLFIYLISYLFCRHC